MQNIKIAFVQANLFWEGINQNLSLFDKHISSIKQEVDLIVLPELFSTGFSMQTSKLAEDMNGSAVQWMKEKAEEKNAVVTGSLMIQDKGKVYNRLIWMQPDGNFKQYDKKHLFKMGAEHTSYSPGNKKLITEYKGWKFCPQVCYDLRFPVWNRNTEDYDCLIFVANWPERRNGAWKTLLQARAIENQAYVIGLNRVGKDGNDIYHSGDSMAIHPDGSILAHKEHEEAVLVLELSAQELNTTREKLPFLQDRDLFSID